MRWYLISGRVRSSLGICLYFSPVASHRAYVSRRRRTSRQNKSLSSCTPAGRFFSRSASTVKSLWASPGAKLISLQWASEDLQRTGISCVGPRQLSRRVTHWRTNNTSFTRFQASSRVLHFHVSCAETSFPRAPFETSERGQCRLSLGPRVPGIFSFAKM